MTAVAYLGPEGTFTHAAARKWLADRSEAAGQLPLDTALAVVAAVESGTADIGVIPIENTIEGVVVPSLDALLAATDVIAVAEVAIPISFDAFVLPDDDGPQVEAVAHPHALAQVTRFIAARHLQPVAASSNAAACRDLQPGQVAFGPADCGPMYGLRTLQRAVEDYHGAYTRFLVLTRRTDASAAAASVEPPRPIRTMLAVTPTETGPGVLARITNAFGGLGVNMSSLVTRPIKAQVGQYVFVVTFDAAPTDSAAAAVLQYLLASGDALKVLATYPADAQTAVVDAVLPEKVPPGSATKGDDVAAVRRALAW